MRIRSSPVFLAVIVGVLWANSAYSQIVLSADELMKHVIENMTKNDILKTEFVSFERTRKEYDLKSDGGCKASDQKGNCTNPLETETSKHGNAYPAAQRGDDGGYSVNLGKILILGYDYVFMERNSDYYRGLPEKYQFECDCYVFWFGSKAVLPNIDLIVPLNASAKDRGIHEAAIRMSGFMYIDKEYLFIRRYVGELTRSFNPDVPYAPDSLAKITMSSMILDQEIAAELNNIVILTNTEIMYQIRQGWFFGHRTRKLVWEWHNYRLNQPVR
ncbi:MAG: hypothetical protein HYX22_00200 [Candidatus Yanofskybacteria bacterium]|nr:hypothetical protein [Candidatus Yanofskybacteria bacterium]